MNLQPSAATNPSPHFLKRFFAIVCLNGIANVQMPSGIPVATVAVDGAKNAALLAVQIMAVTDKELADKLDAQRQRDKEAVLQADRELNERFK